jgi:hypothetical protein
MIQAQLDDAAYADARARGEELTLDEAIELRARIARPRYRYAQERN